MNRLMVNVLNVAIATALATSLAACNRSADAGTSNGAADAGLSAAANAGGGADTAVRYAKVVSVDPVRSTTNTPPIFNSI